MSATTPAGGTVTVNPSTGAFDFDPPPGATGAVTFTYQVCDNGIPGPGVCSTPATVTVTVAGPVIWFVQQGAAGSNDGRLSNPFTSLGSVPGVDNADDGIFLFTGTYSNGLTLLTGEQLIGQGVTGASFESVFGITPPSGTITRPAINGTRPTVQNTITLNTDAEVRGLNIATANVTALTDPVGAITGVTVTEVAVSATTATAVNFSDLNATVASGAITLDSVTSTGGTNNVTLTNVGRTVTLGSGALSGASGTAFHVDTGTATISYSGSVTNTGAARLVNIVSKSSGNVTLSGNLSGTGSSTGVLVQNNTTSGTIAFTGGSKVLTTGANPAITLDNNDSATLNFSGGGLVITTTSGAGFNAINGATAINVSGAGNIITSTTGTALNVNNSTIGGLGLTFQSISANGATNGIVLNTTGTLGGLTVTGDGSITAGMLDRDGSGGTIQNTTDDGVRLDNANNVTFRQMNFIGCGDTPSGGATDATTNSGEHTIQVNGGSNLILSAILVQNPVATGLLVNNLGGTNRLDNDSRFDTFPNGLTLHGIYVNNVNTNMTLFEIKNSRFTNFRSEASTVFFTNTGTSNMTLNVKGSTFDDLDSQALTISGGGTAATSGTLTSVIGGPTAAERNTFRDAFAFNLPTMPPIAVTAENNVGLLVGLGATHTTTLENNLFENIAEEGQIANTSIIRTQNSGGVLNATVKNNVIQNIGYAAGAGGRHVIGHVFEPVSYSASNASNLTLDGNIASNITYTGTSREFIFVDFRPTSSGGKVTIKNHDFDMPTAGSQQMIELRFRQTNASIVNVSVDGNSGSGNTSVAFLDIDAEDGANVNATVTNNDFMNASGTPGFGTSVATEDPAATGGPPTMCANISGNTLTGANTIQLDEQAGTMNVTQGSAAAVAAANGGAAVTVGGTPAFGVAACPLP